MFMVWFERKVIAGMQNRIGPNKAGPFGILQTLADGMKLIFKEDFLPDRADRFVYRLAPFLAFVPAFLVWSVIPLGGDFSDGNDGIVTWFGHATRVQLADPPIGILFVLALSSIAVYGDHARRLVERLEVPVARLGAGVGADGQLRGGARPQRRRRGARHRDADDGGHRRRPGRFADWNLIATGFVPFVIFVIAATAELNRPPFDLVEAEQELVGGFNTEYSSFRFALFFLAEFMNTITMSGGHRHAVPRRAARVGLFDIPLDPRRARGHDLVRRQGVHLPLRLRVVPGDAAAAALRPADGSRLEAADPASRSAGSCCSRRCGSPRTTTGTVGVVGVGRRVRRGRRVGLMVWAPSVSRRNREQEGAMY